MKKNRVIVVGAALVTVAALMLLMITSNSSQADAARATIRPVAVEVATVGLGTVSEEVSVVGTVGALRDVMVSSETAGRVTGVAVNVGDAVTKGDVLVTVDAELKEVAVEQAKAQALAARTSLEKARKDYERTEMLFSAGDVADVELEGYRIALRAAEAQAKAASAGLRYAERQLADTRICAPIAGHVVSRLVEIGEMVSPGREIANIVDISAVKIMLDIPEEDVVKLRNGQKAVLHIDSRPGDAIQGKVSAISAKSSSPNGHTFPVEVLAPNVPGDPLKVGMFVRVTIEAKSAHNVVAVSTQAFVDNNGARAVFVADHGVARLRPVTLGLQGPDRAEVLSGLSEGERIVVFGHTLLKDGSAVQYKEQ